MESWVTRRPPIWGDDIDQVIMRGNTITTEVVFFHRTSGTVLFTDLLQNFPPDWFLRLAQDRCAARPYDR